MKKIITLFLFSLILSSCSKTDDDAGNKCTSDCTTITGKFVSANDEPVPNVRLKLQYESGGGIFNPGKTRKIVDVKSDKEGSFYKNFYIEDQELGINPKGYFNVIVDDSGLDVNKYIRSNNLIGNTTVDMGFTIFSITNRDTIINANFYIPKKAYIKVNLNNFLPQSSEDHFEVQTLYPFGAEIGYNEFLDSKYGTGFSGYDNFNATSQNNQLKVFVAENERNIIRIFKRKNGVNTSEDYPIMVPANNNIVLSFDY